MAKPLQSAVTQTQLRFNLAPGCPSREDLAVRFRKPAPIIIERLSPRQAPNGKQERDAYSSFSAVSRDRLQEAVLLAKRDLRRGAVMRSEPVNSQPWPTGQHVTGLRQKRREVEHGGASVRDQCVSEAVRRGRKEATKEAEEKPKGRTVADVTSWQTGTKAVRERRRAAGSSRQLLNAEEKQALEIFRLRKQLHEQLIKLKAIGSGRTSGLPRHQKEKSMMSRRTLFDDHTDAIELRTAIKAEEQAARSARMLYVLQRQVHEIQSELERQEAQPWKVTHTKKSRSMSRLAAAHRAAVRAIQMFVQTGESNAYSSLRGMEQELAYLIRQLSQCCIDMNIGNPDAVTQMEEILTFGGINEDEEMGRDKEEKQRIPVNGDDRHRPEETDRSLEPKQSTGMSRVQPLITGLPDKQPLYLQREDATSSKRSSTLKAGTDTSRRKRQQRHHHPPSLRRQDVKQRGVLLQSQANMTLPLHLREPGKFSDETVASMMKRRAQRARGQKPQQVKQQMKKGKKLIRQQGDDPNRELETRQKMRKRKGESKLETMKITFQQMMEKEAARQVWLDSETLKQISELKELRHIEQERLDDIRNQRGYHQQTRQIAHSSANLPSSIPVSHTTRSNEETLSSRLSKKAVETALRNADILTETILDDLLKETATELSRIDGLAELEREVESIVTAPTLEGIKERMDAFEVNERTIRRRWLSVQFEDEGHSDHSNKQICSLADNSVAAEHISDGFPQQEVRLTACRPKRQVARPREAQLFYKANIPDVMLQNIMSLQQDYDRHLRLTATHPSGNFNPWKLVERISEQLLEECLSDVADEIEHVCDSYVEDQVYSKEFAQT